MADNAKPPKGEKRYWLDDARNIEKIFWGLVIFCGLLAVVELFVERHGKFAVEHFPVAYGIYGFVCFVGIVFAGKWLRNLVMRDEDYYDR